MEAKDEIIDIAFQLVDKEIAITTAVEKINNLITQSRQGVRVAVANYMGSEGCSCCRNIAAHEKHEKILAELLDVEKYDDNSGYDFLKYRK